MNIPFQTDRAPSAIGPYSQAIISGNMLFVSGQIPLDPETMKVVEGGIKEQAKRAIESLISVVEDAEFGKKSIAKVTVFIKNMDDFAAINEIYADFMGDHRPARAVVEVARLPKDVLIEVECICVR
ncbi:RidA family protein [Seleniivibrio woodruffii]|uniref:RidA family protein n=1 Tax=Seleniivibrio woodruffii TaxID=1078050 RepID=UPI0026E99A78|nr:RidA family protein [Seleniivibrio woodruffii]